MLLADRATLELIMRETGGVPVTMGGVETVGLYDVADELVLDGLVQTGVPTVQVPTGVLPLEIDGQITVGGESWRVREYRRMADGAVTMVALRR